MNPGFQTAKMAVYSPQNGCRHAASFGTEVHSDEEWDWAFLTERHTARIEVELVGFTDVIWDRLVHAWLQDVMVAFRSSGPGSVRRWRSWPPSRRREIARGWLQVDFDDDQADFCLERCGFTPSTAGPRFLQ